MLRTTVWPHAPFFPHSFVTEASGADDGVATSAGTRTDICIVRSCSASYSAAARGRVGKQLSGSASTVFVCIWR